MTDKVTYISGVFGYLIVDIFSTQHILEGVAAISPEIGESISCAIVHTITRTAAFRTSVTMFYRLRP